MYRTKSRNVPCRWLHPYLSGIYELYFKVTRTEKYNQVYINYLISFCFQHLQFFERMANENCKKQKRSSRSHLAFFQVSHIHKQVDGAKVLIYSESASAQKDFTSSSMIAPVLTPCSCACVIIHSLDSGLMRQDTSTLLRLLRPAPSRLPPQFDFSFSITLSSFVFVAVRRLANVKLAFKLIACMWAVIPLCQIIY